MNFETQEINRLYPERASADIGRKIEALEGIESGKLPKIELSEKETAELLAFENTLGENLEPIYKLASVSHTFYPEYFLSDKGREDFSAVTGLDLDGETIQDITVSVLKSRQAIRRMIDEETVSAKEVAELFGRSINFFDNNFFQKLSEQKAADGSLRINPETPLPKRSVMLLTPDISLKKISQLRIFKKFLKEKLADLGSPETHSSGLNEGLREILTLYKKRVNEMIASQSFFGIAAKNTADALDTEAISKEEDALAHPAKKHPDGIKHFFGLSDPEKTLARYDKFIYGASQEYNTSGNREQISKEIETYADQIEKLYLENALSENENIRKKGLDPAKILDATMSVEQYLPWVEELLENCGEKSAYPSSTYDPSREGPAPDNKWQVVTGPEFKTNNIDQKRKVYELGHTENKKRTVESVISVMLGHEIVHIFQRINREVALPFRLFNSVSSDRRGIYAEGGAMYLQDILSTEAFGTRSIPIPHYVRAMSCRLRGGNYLDCVSAFYDSAYRVLKAQLDAGIIDDKTFQKRTDLRLKTAIGSTKRLFNSTVDFSGQSGTLTQSNATAYLEQLLLMDKLKAVGKEKYAYLGVSLETLASLAKLGFFDAAKIKTPPLYALEVWDKIKDSYKLPTSENGEGGGLDKNPELS